MKHKSVADHDFTPEDKLFLDANIWLYMYGPQKPNAYWVRIYSKVFKRILKAKSKVYTDVLVVSEFINRYARLRWRIDESNFGEFDEFNDFRNSPHFKPVAQDIAADVTCVLNDSSRIGSGFETLQIDGLLDEYADGNFDFNDQVITELCKTNGLTLITNDSDFKDAVIPVLTANKSLLS